MKLRQLLTALAAVVSAGACAGISPGWMTAAQAQNQSASSLSGQVSSAREGLMEGVLVTAQKVGSTISVTVVSNQGGVFSFPRSKIDAGNYELRIRAAGYDLDGDKTVNVAAAQTTKRDLKLVPAKDLAAQLSNSEWVQSTTGTDQQKTDFLRCVNCHTLERIFRSKHNATEFEQLLVRMANYTNNSLSNDKVQHAQVRSGKFELTDVSLNSSTYKRIAAYLATVNLSARDTWNFGLQTFARPHGRATRVIVTEYDLPRLTMEPHDAFVGKDGIVWASNFGEQTLIRLDPKTGKVTEYPVPTAREGYPTGIRSLSSDGEGTLWLGNQYQGNLLSFDIKTEKFKSYPLTKELLNGATQISAAGAQRSNVDGKVWTQNNGIPAIHRLDIATGTFDTFDPYKGQPKASHNLYDVWPDAQNNVYFPDFSHESIGRIDAKTGEITTWQAPTRGSRPRRGSVDANGKVWYAGFGANLVGMFDPATKQFKEWRSPSPWAGPYDVITDKNGDAWSGGQLSDRVMRIDPKTSVITEYLLPRQTDIRHAHIDQSTPLPTFWVGNDHGASIIKVEPLD